MTILRSFLIQGGAREGTFQADVVRFHGLADAHQFGIAILTECMDNNGARPLSALIGPHGRFLPPAAKATEPTWHFYVTLEWEAMPVTGGEEPFPIGGLFLPSGGALFVSVRREP